MGEDETGWGAQGKMNIIIEKLITTWCCKPMIFAMSNGECSPMFRPRQGEDLNEARKHHAADFTHILLIEIIPYVEQTFRVLTD